MDVVEMVIRIAMAIVIGGLVGYERESKNKTAGFRTHILVCVGAAVISMIQIISIYDTAKLVQENPVYKDILGADIGRLGAQVITGVGFLGAGAIIREKGAIKGLTTAASLWVVACIGLAVGLGYYSLSLLATISLFVVLVVLKKFENIRFEKPAIIKFKIVSKDSKATLRNTTLYLNKIKVKIKDIELKEASEETLEKNEVVEFKVAVPHDMKAEELRECILQNEEIIIVSIEYETEVA